MKYLARQDKTLAWVSQNEIKLESVTRQYLRSIFNILHLSKFNLERTFFPVDCGGLTGNIARPVVLFIVTYTSGKRSGA